jgi:hypothetical protein
MFIILVITARLITGIRSAVFSTKIFVLYNEIYIVAVRRLHWYDDHDDDNNNNDDDDNNLV